MCALRGGSSSAQRCPPYCSPPFFFRCSHFPPRALQSLLPTLGADGVWEDPAFVFLALAQKLASLAYYLVMLAVCSRMGEVVWYSRAAWISRFSGAPSAV